MFPFYSENLIRMAFQCLQLVAADFLPTMPCTCLQVVVEVTARFGLQKQELNVSLTAVGLLVSYSNGHLERDCFLDKYIAIISGSVILL